MLSVRGWIAILLVAFTVQAGAVNPAELLDPRDAFRLSVRALDNRTAQIDFRIAPGYYLYRDYRDRVSIKVPLSAADVARKQVRLKIVSQGCAAVGVCYIPQEQWVDVKLDRFQEVQ